MISIETLAIAIVLLGLAQDSCEDQFLPVPMSATSEDQATDRTFRNRLAICQFLCRSKRIKRFEKETSPSLCLRGCARDGRAGESSSSFEINTKLKSSTSRSRRNTKEQEEECLQPSEWERKQSYGSQMPKSIDVNFVERKPNLSVKWSPAFHETFSNWTSYALMYKDAEHENDKYRCILIPKDRLEWVIKDGDAWTYPDKIYLGIATYPYHKVDFKIYGPTPPAPPTLPPEKEGSTKVIVAISGVVAGLLLLLVLILVYRKRINSCSLCSRETDRRVALENTRINNSCLEENDNTLCPKINNDLKLSGPEFFYACYYPESERFTLQVASVVNFFRENGYRVVMDVMDCNELVKLGPTRWAEQQIKKAHKILVFLSPGLLRLCGTDDEDSHYSNQENERVWYEMSLLRTIYSQTHSGAKMVCIILPAKTGIDSRDLPLWAELRYRWPEDKTKILNRLNDRPFIQPW